MRASYKEIRRIVEERHPRGEITTVQTLRLGAIKLLEEALEAATTIALPREMSGPIDDLSDKARMYFRWREWLAYSFANERPSDASLAAMRGEVADVFIVIIHLAGLIEELTGEEFDLEAEALKKALADLRRQ